MAWWSRGRTHRRTVRGSRTRGSEPVLDRITPPTYDMSLGRHEQARVEIADLIGRLQPGALGPRSREVLNNLINARTDAQLAELDAARDERLAAIDKLAAHAAEQVARYKPGYDADLARVAQTGAALAATYEALTGRTPTEFVPPRPRRIHDGNIESTLGPVDLSDDALPLHSPGGFPSEQGGGFR
jgi:hypothetical protein